VPLKRGSPARSCRDRSVQTRANTQLRPWLNYAAPLTSIAPLLPPDWHDSPEVVRPIVSKTLRSRLPGGPAMLDAMLRFCGGPLRKTGVRWADAAVDEVVDRLLYKMLVELFRAVREVLDWEAAAGADSSVGHKGPAGWRLMWPPPKTMALVMPAIRGDGAIGFLPNPAWRAFMQALRGANGARLRRCPICSELYFAVRDNKSACDKHLVLARTWRKRGKLPEYKKNRDFRKKARLKGVRGRPGPAPAAAEKVTEDIGEEFFEALNARRSK